MNSTKLHSLLRDAGREMTLGGFGLQRWRARKRIKGRGKTGGDSPRQALQTESATWNTCRLRRIPTGGKNWRGSPGLGNGEKKREKKKKRKRQLGQRIELGSGGAERADERC